MSVPSLQSVYSGQKLMRDHPEVMTQQEAATYLRVKVRTLRGWRARGHGPSYIRIYGRPRYRKVDLDQWLSDLTVIM